LRSKQVAELPDATADILKPLRHWRTDPDLAGVRDTDALARVSESERREWLALWGTVDALIERAEGHSP
jgi:hypothetical protein